MKNKMEELEIIIFQEDVQIIIITETWVRKQEEKYYNFKNFKSVYATREKTGGGVGIFIKNSYNFEILEKIESDFSYISIKMKIFNLIICAVYKSPSIKNNFFMNFLDEKLENLTTLNMECLLIGDININVLDETNDTKRLLDIYHSNNFKLCNNKISTRDTTSNKSLLDHVLSNYVNNIKINFKMSPISDHKIQILDIPTKIKKNIPKYENFTINKFHIEKLRNELSILDCRKHSFEDINEYYDSIIETFEKSMYKITIKRKNNSKPWFTEEISNYMKIRDKLYEKKKKYPNNINYVDEYGYYNKKVKKLIRETKQNFYKKTFNNSNNKCIWKHLNFLLTSKSKDNISSIPNLFVNNKIIEDQQLICEEMNYHFTSIGPKLSAQILDKNRMEEELNSKSIFLDENEIIDQDIKEIIDNLDINKASGYDNITVKIIKTVKIQLVPIIKYLVKLSLRTSKFPEKMKYAKVSPIFKNGDKSNPNNYRPISVLPVLSKILEKIINKKLSYFLENKNLLFNNQYGFRKSRDSEVAAMDVITNIQLNLDNNKKCGIVSLDLCKAFDTVNHDILLIKLFEIGIRGNIYRWFENYIKNRKQYIKLGNNVSSYMKITCGVPQGSILGPTLFLIYINSLSKLKLNGEIKLFADDTTIVYFANSITEIYSYIQDDLKIIFNWLESYKLTLNFSKSSFMYISKKKININKNPIIFNGKKLNYKNNIKFLGLFIDENLSWRKHIEHIRNCISPLIGILFKIRNYVPLKYLKFIYYALVHSKMQYLISIWGSANLTVLQPLKKLQNKIIKCIHKLPYLEPTINLYKPKGYFDIVNLYNLRICIFIHSLILKEKYSSIKFQKVNDLHTHETRQNNLLKTAKVKSNVGKKSLLYSGFQIYNKLPKKIKEIKKIIVFKNNLKKHFLK